MRAGAAARGGAVLDVGPARAGLRSYVAFAGGVAVPPVLGSRSRDLLSGLGPDPLADGARLPLGAPCGPPAAADVVPWAAPPRRAGWSCRSSSARATTGSRRRPCGSWRGDGFRVSSASNRIGLRTDGPALPRARTDELPSEGMVLGAVQVPPAGRPVVFLADHPTTGGYPVVGVVPAPALAAAAQAAPGTPVRFVPVRA
ncbi:hypothetical protein GCM10020000_68590 [Streptomyces olivoverticillatus]